MKVKDLEGINPEAEIVVCFADGSQFNGKLDFGWSSENDSGDNSKQNCKEVVIFLGNNTEYIS